MFIYYLVCMFLHGEEHVPVHSSRIPSQVQLLRSSCALAGVDVWGKGAMMRGVGCRPVFMTDVLGL